MTPDHFSAWMTRMLSKWVVFVVPLHEDWRVYLRPREGEKSWRVFRISNASGADQAKMAAEAAKIAREVGDGLLKIA